MAAITKATNIFQLSMVTIQNRISVTRKEIVTLDETSRSVILSAMARSKLAEVGFKDWENVSQFSYYLLESSDLIWF